MSVKILNSLPFLSLSLMFSCFALSEELEDLNVEFLVDNNLQGEYYDYGYTVRGLLHKDVFNLGLGIKGYNDYENKNNIKLDVVGLFDLYNDKQVNIGLGAGFEGRSPKIEYAIGYKLSPKFSIKAGLRHILSRDYDENYTDFSLGFIYTLHSNSHTKKSGEYSNSDTDVVKDNSLLVIQDQENDSISDGDELVINNIQQALDDNTVEVISEQTDFYTVKNGDHLYKIARLKNTTLERLLKVNNFKNPDVIFPGQIIKL